MRHHERRSHEDGELQAVLPCHLGAGGKRQDRRRNDQRPERVPSHQSNHSGAKRCQD